jgi:hypothetical protein
MGTNKNDAKSTYNRMDSETSINERYTNKIKQTAPNRKAGM